MILPSNNSMRYLPENNHFHYAITPHCRFTRRIRRRTKQDPILCTFLHVRQGGEMCSDSSILNMATRSIKIHLAKKAVILNGNYKNIESFISAINTAYKSAKLHFYFEQQNATGEKIDILFNCENDGNCKKIHYISFYNNLLQIFGLTDHCISYLTHKIHKSNSIVHNTLSQYTNTIYYHNILIQYTNILTFIKLNFLVNVRTQIISFWSEGLYNLWRNIPDKLFVYFDVCAPSFQLGDTQFLYFE